MTQDLKLFKVTVTDVHGSSTVMEIRASGCYSAEWFVRETFCGASLRFRITAEEVPPKSAREQWWELFE